MITIAEVPEYIRDAEKLLSAAERQDVLSYLAAHPKSGDLMEGTGGVRKLPRAGVDAARVVVCGLSTTTTAS